MAVENGVSKITSRKFLRGAHFMASGLVLTDEQEEAEAMPEEVIIST